MGFAGAPAPAPGRRFAGAWAVLAVLAVAGIATRAVRDTLGGLPAAGQPLTTSRKDRPGVNVKGDYAAIRAELQEQDKSMIKNKEYNRQEGTGAE